MISYNSGELDQQTKSITTRLSTHGANKDLTLKVSKLAKADSETC